MRTASGDPDAYRRPRPAPGDVPGVLVAAIVEPGCEACRAMVRAVDRFARYPGVTTTTIEVPPGSPPPGGLGPDDVPVLLVTEGGAERMRRHGHHEEEALVSSIRHALDDVPPAYEHR